MLFYLLFATNWQLKPFDDRSDCFLFYRSQDDPKALAIASTKDVSKDLASAYIDLCGNQTNHNPTNPLERIIIKKDNIYIRILGIKILNAGLLLEYLLSKSDKFNLSYRCRVFLFGCEEEHVNQYTSDVIDALHSFAYLYNRVQEKHYGPKIDCYFEEQKMFTAGAFVVLRFPIYNISPGINFWGEDTKILKVILSKLDNKILNLSDIDLSNKKNLHRMIREHLRTQMLYTLAELDLRNQNFKTVVNVLPEQPEVSIPTDMGDFYQAMTRATQPLKETDKRNPKNLLNIQRVTDFVWQYFPAKLILSEEEFSPEEMKALNCTIQIIQDESLKYKSDDDSIKQLQEHIKRMSICWVHFSETLPTPICLKKFEKFSVYKQGNPFLGVAYTSNPRYNLAQGKKAAQLLVHLNDVGGKAEPCLYYNDNYTIRVFKELHTQDDFLIGLLLQYSTIRHDASTHIHRAFLPDFTVSDLKQTRKQIFELLSQLSSLLIDMQTNEKWDPSSVIITSTTQGVCAPAQFLKPLQILSENDDNGISVDVPSDMSWWKSTKKYTKKTIKDGIRKTKKGIRKFGGITYPKVPQTIPKDTNSIDQSPVSSSFVPQSPGPDNSEVPTILARPAEKFSRSKSVWQGDYYLGWLFHSPKQDQLEDSSSLVANPQPTVQDIIDQAYDGIVDLSHMILKGDIDCQAVCQFLRDQDTCSVLALKLSQTKILTADNAGIPLGFFKFLNMLPKALVKEEDPISFDIQTAIQNKAKEQESAVVKRILQQFPPIVWTQIPQRLHLPLFTNEQITAFKISVDTAQEVINKKGLLNKTKEIAYKLIEKTNIEKEKLKNYLNSMEISWDCE